jgi:hypothetical protein
MENYEKNKNLDLYFFNEIIFKNTKNKKETKAEKKERIRIRMLTILDSIEKNLKKIKPHSIGLIMGHYLAKIKF